MSFIHGRWDMGHFRRCLEILRRKYSLVTPDFRAFWIRREKKRSLSQDLPSQTALGHQTRLCVAVGSKTWSASIVRLLCYAAVARVVTNIDESFFKKEM